MSRWESVAVLVLALLAVLALMRTGWARRGRRQSDLPEPPAPPAGRLPAGPGAVEGVYVSTTTEGDWLDRVVAHGLGTRSPVLVDVRDDGVLLDRGRARPLWIPAGALTGVRRERGMAGKYVGREGLVVLTWRLGQHRLDTGLRTRRAADADALTPRLQRLIGERA